MPTSDILALLIAERDKLNQAIEALDGPTKRIGRPPKTALAAGSAQAEPLAVETPAPSVKQRRRRTFTAAQRRQQAARMKAYWAKKRKKQG